MSDRDTPFPGDFLYRQGPAWDLEDDFEPLPIPEVTGSPANKLGDTATYEALVARLGQKAAAALYLSATGEDLLANQSITLGHVHDTFDTYRRWRQLGSWRPPANDDLGDFRGGYVIDFTTATDFLFTPFRVPLTTAGTVSLLTRLTPRMRFSLPAPTVSTHTTLFVTVTVKRRSGASLFVNVGTGTFAPQSFMGSTFSDVWREGSPITLDTAEVVTAEGRLFALWTANLQSIASSQKAVIWEVELNTLTV